MQQMPLAKRSTLAGVTRPVSLGATFNGGYAGHPIDPHARVGFSARGSLKRSEFGIAYGVPAPGSKSGVGDDVDVIIEASSAGLHGLRRPRKNKEKSRNANREP